MQLLTRLQDEMKAALRAGQKERVGVIRMLMSDVKNIDLNPARPTPEQAVEAYTKKLRKSADEFAKVGRADEVTKLNAEIAICEEFLPKKLDEAATRELVVAFLKSTPFDARQAGQATGAFMKQHGGNVDAGLASRLIREQLA
jgi:hypothetical protein